MCYGCWEDEYDKSLIDTPAVRDAVTKIEAVYDESCVGGAPHIVIDDWNVEDESVEWCGSKANVECIERELTTAERECLTALRSLTVAGRASALAFYEGYTA